MRETRVNLKHLLEDIRDSYISTIEEVILLELIANALDSGASRISFFVDLSENSLTVIDNGRGMKRKDLSNYHNIASTTKIKGKGIGFAGVGAKLSLLIAKKVITETKGGYGTRAATEWFLKNDISAPWKFIPFSGKVKTSKGSSVSVFFKSSQNILLSEEFISKTIYNYFYPLFHQDLFGVILKSIYKKGVDFFINDKKIVFQKPELFNPKVFKIRLSGRGRQLVGVGFLAKNENSSEIGNFLGLGVSTYGKVIKSGWEWVGISAKAENIYGMVELPGLSAILTTNKADFLKDTTSLKKYYQYRKAIQEAVYPLLRELGEELNLTSRLKQYKSLSKEIERTLKNVLRGFPELTPLIGIKGSGKKSGFDNIAGGKLINISENDYSKEESKEENKNKDTKKLEEKERKESKNSISTKNRGSKSPYLSIEFEKREDKGSLARIIENKILINSSHPAYLKAIKEKSDQYHIVFCTALTLSSFLEDRVSSEKFINDFLIAWGKDDKKTATLFKIN